MAKKEAAQAPADGEAKPAGKMKLIIIIAIAVLLAVGLSAGGTWFFLSKKDDGAADKAKEEVAAEPAAPVKQAAIYEELAPAFVVNFNHQGRARYMQVSVALMTRDQVALDALKIHMPVLRNRLVMLFSSQDFASLISPVGKEMLRQQATASVQELAEKEVGKVTVEQVLFTNLVLQ
ncbi:flagellar basal body-associated protein FliL [Pseudomonas sp. SL4(2022)]|uniref:flagellar basal body-associated protein FliL n=1 Tax=Pseudomonas sp. SL4(2022) TaxID=2994661 RepID=UPI0022708BD6|nr:flagellar basal body-associated protein FliL [Pseudomonas sp. SL4(2022)]WAC43617.1 flagellar basal body-associated protein FliL [Pseudomonas sp. SL4(2022)]